MTMKHEMRRFKQQLPHDEALHILDTCTNGVLSLVDVDGEPYGVPLSFAYDGADAIYFHSALSGHKVDAIKAQRQCSFCVVAGDDIRPDEFTTYFRSVIVSGKIAIVTDEAERIKGLQLLCDKYSPGVDSRAEIAGCLSRVLVLKLTIDAVSGKEAIELTRRR